MLRHRRAARVDHDTLGALVPVGHRLHRTPNRGLDSLAELVIRETLHVLLRPLVDRLVRRHRRQLDHRRLDRLAADDLRSSVERPVERLIKSAVVAEHELHVIAGDGHVGEPARQVALRLLDQFELGARDTRRLDRSNVSVQSGMSGPPS